MNIQSWLGQVTTGHGVMIIGPTLLAVMSGTMSWQMAVPLLIAGAVGLLWPENTPLATAAQQVAADAVKAAPATLADIQAIQQAYLKGVEHGNAAAQLPAPPSLPTPEVKP